MAKMSELDLVLQEFHAAAKAIINAADNLRDLYSQSAELAVPAETKQETPKPAPLTLETVRAVLAEKSRNGHTAEVRMLLEKHGASKLSEIDPAEFTALLAETEDIK